MSNNSLLKLSRYVNICRVRRFLPANHSAITTIRLCHKKPQEGPSTRIDLRATVVPNWSQKRIMLLLKMYKTEADIPERITLQQSNRIAGIRLAILNGISALVLGVGCFLVIYTTRKQVRSKPKVAHDYDRDPVDRILQHPEPKRIEMLDNLPFMKTPVVDSKKPPTEGG